jgi:hypothetical protein
VSPPRRRTCTPTGWEVFGAAAAATLGALDIVQGVVALADDGTDPIAEPRLLLGDL